MLIRTGESHLIQVIERHAMDGRVDVVDLKFDNRFWSINKALLRDKSLSMETRFFRPIVAFDPGETTGIAVWDPSAQQILLAQLNTRYTGDAFDAISSIINYLASDKPALQDVRYEDYRVYGHMTETHAWSKLHTVRIIGVIEVACHIAQVKWSKCLAVHAKTFWTDEKLKMCDIYNKGMRHARDAERHLLRFMGENDS